MVQRAIEIAKLDERINDRIRNYSKGMVRKLLVALGKILESGAPGKLREKYNAENLEQVFVQSITK